MRNKTKLKFSQEIIIYTNGCKSPFSSYLLCPNYTCIPSPSSLTSLLSLQANEMLILYRKGKSKIISSKMKFDIECSTLYLVS